MRWPLIPDFLFIMTAFQLLPLRILRLLCYLFHKLHRHLCRKTHKLMYTLFSFSLTTQNLFALLLSGNWSGLSEGFIAMAAVSFLEVFLAFIASSISCWNRYVRIIRKSYRGRIFDGKTNGILLPPSLLARACHQHTTRESCAVCRTDLISNSKFGQEFPGALRNAQLKKHTH